MSLTTWMRWRNYFASLLCASTLWVYFVVSAVVDEPSTCCTCSKCCTRRIQRIAVLRIVLSTAGDGSIIVAQFDKSHPLMLIS